MINSTEPKTKDIISSDLSFDDKNSWKTDPVVFNALDQEFNFFLDASATKENALCKEFLTKYDCGLKSDWTKVINDRVCQYEYYQGRIDTVWINPPYGRGYIKKFMDKCIEQKEKGITSVMLVPATLDAQWLPINSISEIRIITGGRLSFYHPITNKKINGNTKGSMLVIFRPSKMPCVTRLIDRDELLNLGKTGLNQTTTAA